MSTYKHQGKWLQKSRGKQSGLVILLMLAVAMMVSMQLMSMQLSGQITTHETERQQRLKFAKENLIALAVNYMDIYGASGAGPGHLPCPNSKVPDANRNSQGPDTPCSGDDFVIGRLPRLVGVDYKQRVLNYQPDEYDAQNALWYVVSTNFVNSPFKKINADTSADLSFNQLDDVVAVLFDSGATLDQQKNSRPSADFQDYLELEFNDTKITASSFSNDRSLPITLRDIQPMIFARVAAKAAEFILQFNARHCSDVVIQTPCFPYASLNSDSNCTEGLLEGWLAINAGDCTRALFDDIVLEDVPISRHWFMRNQWYQSIRYKVDASCIAATLLGCEINVSTEESEGVVHPLLHVMPIL